MDEKLKVLLLTNIPSPYMVDYLNELGKYCDLTVVFERESSAARDSSWKNWKAKRFQSIILKGLKLRGPEADMAISPQVIKYIDKSYDKIIVCNPCTPTGIIACLYMNALNISHGFQSEGAFPGSGKGWKEKIKKIVYTKGDFFFSTAELEDQYYAMYGADRKKIKRYPFTSLYYNEVLNAPLLKKAKDIIKNKLGIPFDYLVVSMGRLIPRKGYEVLIKAFKGFDKNVGFYIIGDEPTGEYLALREEYNENVVFLPFQDKETIKEYYKAADVFVLNTREETWGLVINEAMSFGIPVITTNRCYAALSMIESGKEGFVLEVDDVSDFHEKIKLLLEDEQLRYMMGEYCLQKSQSYTIENMAKVVIRELSKGES